MVSLIQIKTYCLNQTPKIIPTIGMITFGSAGILMARKCCLIAHGCAIQAGELSLHAFKEKALESANKGILQIGLAISVCDPEYTSIAAYSIAAVASGVLAYQYGRKVFRQPPPLPPRAV